MAVSLALAMPAVVQFTWSHSLEVYLNVNSHHGLDSVAIFSFNSRVTLWQKVPRQHKPNKQKWIWNTMNPTFKVCLDTSGLNTQLSKILNRGGSTLKLLTGDHWIWTWCSSIKELLPIFVWRAWEKSGETTVRTTSAPAENQAQNLTNKILEHYCYTNSWSPDRISTHIQL
jgi:hypothetical protein